MAQRVTTNLIDDISGETINDGEGRTVPFGFDGQAYEIDLSNDNVDAFREKISDFIAAARKTSGSRTVRSAGTAAKPGRTDPDELAKIREWASKNGYEVSSRGRIAQAVRDAYNAAH